MFANDTDQPWNEDYSLQRLDFSGEVLEHVDGSISVAPRSVASVRLPETMTHAGKASRELVRVLTDERAAQWFFSEYRDSELEAPRWSARLDREGDAYALHVEALTLVRDLSVLIDKLDPSAQVDSMLTTLLPGESVSIRFESKRDLSVSDVDVPRVLRCANQLVNS